MTSLCPLTVGQGRSRDQGRRSPSPWPNRHHRHRHARPHHGRDQLALEELRGKKCQSIVFADSISAVSADDYRFSDHPALIAVFRSTFDRIAALGCDFLLTPHPGGSGVRAAVRREPLASPGQCAAYAPDRARAPRQKEDGSHDRLETDPALHPRRRRRRRWRGKLDVGRSTPIRRLPPDEVTTTRQKAAPSEAYFETE